MDKFLPNHGSRLNHLDRSVELLRKHHNFATPNSVSANTHVTHVIECWSVMQTSQFIQFPVDGFLILTPKNPKNPDLSKCYPKAGHKRLSMQLGRFWFHHAHHAHHAQRHAVPGIAKGCSSNLTCWGMFHRYL